MRSLRNSALPDEPHRRAARPSLSRDGSWLSLHIGGMVPSHRAVHRIRLAAALLLVFVMSALSDTNTAPLGDPAFRPTREHPFGWRGNGSGCFPAAEPPLDWHYSEVEMTSTNVLWRLPLSEAEDPIGHHWTWGGHASPVLVGDRLFVLQEPCWLVCIDKDSGGIRWKRRIGFEVLGTAGEAMRFPMGGWVTEPYGYTLPTPVTDGRYIWCVFGHGIVSCHTVDGNLVWAQPYKAWDPRTERDDGRSESPCLIGDVLVTAGEDQDSYIGWEADTGRRLWAIDERTLSYASRPGSPGSEDSGRGSLRVAEINGTQYALTVEGYLLDPRTGNIVWKSLVERGGNGSFCNHIATPAVGDGYAIFVQAGKRSARDSALYRVDLEVSKNTTARWRLGKAAGGKGSFRSPLLIDGLVYVAGSSLTAYNPEDGSVAASAAVNTVGLSCGPVYAGGYLFQITYHKVHVFKVGAQPKPYISYVRGINFAFPCDYHDGAPFMQSPVFEGRRMYVRGHYAVWCFDASLAETNPDRSPSDPAWRDPMQKGDVAALRRILQETGIAGRRRCFLELAAPGSDLTPFAPLLAAQLARSHETAAYHAAMGALFAMGPANPTVDEPRAATGPMPKAWKAKPRPRRLVLGPKAGALLTHLLTHADAEVRAGAAHGLRRAAEPSAVIPSLEKALHDSVPEVGLEAAGTLRDKRYMRHAMAVWRRALNSPEPRVRTAALRTYSRLGNALNRTAAALGAQASPRLPPHPAIARLCDSTDAETRAAAMSAFVTMYRGKAPGVSQDQAARLLRSALYEVPDTAARACALLASLGSHGIPTLVDAVAEAGSHPCRAQTALNMLTRMEPAALRPHLPRMTKAADGMVCPWFWKPSNLKLRFRNLVERVEQSGRKRGRTNEEEQEQ